jgi:threonine dehydrogenase-like Zn-dependent dehydrogenase
LASARRQTRSPSVRSGSQARQQTQYHGITVSRTLTPAPQQVGDKIVSPFTTSCQSCFYCKLGFSSRCTSSLLFGTAALDGGQAEFVRIPHADGTVMKAPSNINDKALVLMADIFPTGFFGANNGFRQLERDGMKAGEQVAVVIGCGPVGLCAVIAALEWKPKHLFAVDSVDSRLEQARKLGAEPLNFMTDKEGMMKRIKEVTDGRGADVVVEVVGLSPALKTAFDLLRPWGVISSIGVHNGEVGFLPVVSLPIFFCVVWCCFAAARSWLWRRPTQHAIRAAWDENESC